MARWFRLLIDKLHRNGNAFFGEALNYVNQAVEYVRANPVRLPNDPALVQHGAYSTGSAACRLGTARTRWRGESHSWPSLMLGSNCV